MKTCSLAEETNRVLLTLLTDNVKLYNARMGVLTSLFTYTAEIPYSINVTMLHRCIGSALEGMCSHCGSKHKLKALCLAFCVSCHKDGVAAFPPIPVPAAAL